MTRVSCAAAAAALGLALSLVAAPAAQAVDPSPSPEAATPRADGTAPTGSTSIESSADVAPVTAPSTAERPVTSLIVRLSGGATAASGAVRAAAAELAGVETARSSRRLASGATLVTLSEPVSVADAWTAARALTARADVAYAEPDIWVGLTDASPSTPNDPRFGEQWDLWDSAGDEGGYASKAPAAWTRTTGSPSVVVAVIDTGITSHPDLAGQTVAGYDFISDTVLSNDGGGRDPNPSDPGDWVTRAESENPAGDYYRCDITRSSWHGTHVAGTIVARRDNGIGVSGLAPDVRVQPVRALGKCGGRLSDIADAVEWASGGTVSGVPANATPAKVVNMSLGGAGSCAVAGTMQSAISHAVARGTTVVVAAGNEGRSITYDPNDSTSGAVPANCSDVVTVVATGRTGELAPYSNFGTIAGTIALAAQGGDDSGLILSTFNAGSTRPGTPTYGSYQGTSMAAPHVAAAAALLQSTRVGRSSWYSPAEVRDRLAALTQPTGCPTTRCGAGILDLSVAGGFETFAPLDVRDVHAEAAEGSAELTWLAPLDDGGLPVTYRVEQSTEGDAYTEIATTAATSASVTGLANGTSVTFRVTATNTSGDSEPTITETVVPGTVTVPRRPAAPSVTGGIERLTSSWAAPPSDGGSPVTGWSVQYRRAGTSDWSCVDHAIEPGCVLDAAAMSGSVAPWPTPLAAGGYETRVAAVNAIGTSLYSRLGTTTVTALTQSATTSATTLRPLVDGFQDSVRITAASNLVTSGSIRILSSRGTAVHTVSLAPGTAWSYVWTGRDGAGARVATGTYRAQVLLTGRGGAPTQVAVRTILVASSYAGRPSVSLSDTTVYPVKDGYRDTTVVRAATTVPATYAIRVTRRGRTLWSTSLSRRTAATVVWRGKDDRGRRVPSGRYRITVRARGGEGPSATTSRTIRVSSQRLRSKAFRVDIDATRASPTRLTSRQAVPDGSGGLLLGPQTIVAFAPRLPSSVRTHTRVQVHSCSTLGGDVNADVRFQYMRSGGRFVGNEVAYGNRARACWSGAGASAPLVSLYSGRVHLALGNLYDGSRGDTWQLSSFRITGVRYYLS